MTSVLLPEPDTPVTQVKIPSGKSTVTFLRLWCVAPTTVRLPPLARRRVAGTAIVSRPDRYAPVRERGWAAISAGVPSATTLPPSSPAPGPRSTT